VTPSVCTSDISKVFFKPKRDNIEVVVALMEGREKGALFLFFEFESSEDEEEIVDDEEEVDDGKEEEGNEKDGKVQSYTSLVTKNFP
jgi:hypothetical protein